MSLKTLAQAFSFIIILSLISRILLKGVRLGGSNVRTWQERITVLSVSRMFRDKLMLCGINDYGNWRRLSSLSYYDLEKKDNGTTLKIFGRSELTCYNKPKLSEDYFYTHATRTEDCEFLQEPAPLFLNEIKAQDRNTFIKNCLDGNVSEAFSKNRTLGLIEPYVEQVYFGWSDVYKNFESSIVFLDKSGQRYKFYCTDLKWYYSWIYLFQKKKELLYQELDHLPHRLNKNGTYFVIGLTKPVEEVPGSFRGCWPMIQGIHSF